MRKNNLIFILLGVFVLVGAGSLVYFGVVQQSVFGDSAASIDYHHECLDVESEGDLKFCARMTVPLSSCEFTVLSTSLARPKKECEGSFLNKSVESVSCFGESCGASKLVNGESVVGVVGTHVNPDGSSVKETKYEYSFFPEYSSSENPGCWEVVTDQFGVFNLGEEKRVDEFTTVKNVGFVAKMRGGVVYDGYSDWLINIDRRGLFSEPTENVTQLEFNKPFTARVSLVYLGSLDFCGGVEGKIEEIGFFQGTQFTTIDQKFDIKKGCTFIDAVVPTDRLKRVQEQFNPIIFTSQGNVIGYPYRWTYDRRMPDVLTEKVSSVSYSCPSAPASVVSNVAIPPPFLGARASSYGVDWAVWIPVGIVVVGLLVGVGIVLTGKKGRK